MLRLITIPFSHYCEKARWALEHAGVPFREEGHVPVFHMLAVRRAGGRRQVPFLVGDGRVWSDSEQILSFADEKAPPARKLLPDDPERRREALALEARFGVELGPQIRRAIYFHLLPDRAAMTRMMRIAVPSWEKTALATGYPLVSAVIRRGTGAEEGRVARSLAKVRAIFAEVSARVENRRYLVGDAFSAADLTFAALGGAGVAAEGYGFPLPQEGLPEPVAALVSELRATPAGAYVRRIYAEHRRAAAS